MNQTNLPVDFEKRATRLDWQATARVHFNSWFDLPVFVAIWERTMEKILE